MVSVGCAALGCRLCSYMVSVVQLYGVECAAIFCQLVVQFYGVSCLCNYGMSFGSAGIWCRLRSYIVSVICGTI